MSRDTSLPQLQATVIHLTIVHLASHRLSSAILAGMSDPMNLLHVREILKLILFLLKSNNE